MDKQPVSLTEEQMNAMGELANRLMMGKYVDIVMPYTEVVKLALLVKDVERHAATKELRAFCRETKKSIDKAVAETMKLALEEAAQKYKEMKEMKQNDSTAKS